MVYIISGTNRKESRTLDVSQIVLEIFLAYGAQAEIVDLSLLPFEKLTNLNYGKELPSPFKEIIEKLNTSEGLYIVTPEYNGSIPGILKYFIDYFAYPETFEYRPIAFTGIGGRWGGVRPVEHLQQVFNYRNGFIYPVRVFISHVGEAILNGRLKDKGLQFMLEKQVEGYIKFLRALRSENLDASSRNS